MWLTILFLFIPLIIIIIYSFNESKGAEFTNSGNLGKANTVIANSGILHNTATGEILAAELYNNATGEFENNNLELAALDGFRMAIAKAPLEASDKKVLAPARILNEVSKNINMSFILH